MPEPAVHAVATELRRLASSGDTGATSHLRASVDALAADRLVLGPLAVMTRRIQDRVIEWVDTADAADAVLAQRWNEAAAAELADYAMDPAGYLDGECRPFVRECSAVFGVAAADVGSILDRLHHCHESVRRGVLFALAGLDSLELGSSFWSTLREQDPPLADPARSSFLLAGFLAAAATPTGRSEATRLLALLSSHANDARSLEGSRDLPTERDRILLRNASVAVSRSGSKKQVSGELRLRLSRFLDDRNRSNRFIVDAGDNLDRYWPGSRDFGSATSATPIQTPREVGVIARALAEIDPRLGALTLASAAALEADDLDTVDAVTAEGIRFHGTRGRGAVFAINRALVHRCRGEWLQARSCYVQALRSRVARYRCMAIAGGAMAALDFDDEEAALRFCDRGLTERSDLLHQIFDDFHQARLARGADTPASDAHVKLRALLIARGRNPERILGTNS